MKLSRGEAEDFLFMEAELLDQRRYEEWLKLFTADGIYWLPMQDNADPALAPSVLYDDAHTRSMRVHQLVHKPHYSQRPPSRTVHAISNVVVRPSQAGEALVKCNVMVTEMREGNYQQLGLGEQRVFSGHCEYRLRAMEGRPGIALKKLLLVNRDVPISNLSFIL
jgi:3-phenylpropionate/cinnamic acid dioxygenase small subunit